METEQWRSITDTDGLYEVSSFGRIRSLRWQPPRIMALNRNPRHGYLMIHFVCNGVRSAEYIYRLVLRAFLGPCPPNQQVCHNDGNPANNHVANLRYDTVKNNHRDKIRHGTRNRGERHGNAKLKETMVASIRADFNSGMRQADIARKYQLSKKTVWYIVHGKAWGWSTLIPKQNEVAEAVHAVDPKHVRRGETHSACEDEGV